MKDIVEKSVILIMGIIQVAISHGIMKNNDIEEERNTTLILCWVMLQNKINGKKKAALTQGYNY